MGSCFRDEEGLHRNCDRRRVFPVVRFVVNFEAFFQLVGLRCIVIHAEFANEHVVFPLASITPSEAFLGSVLLIPFRPFRPLESVLIVASLVDLSILGPSRLK